MSDAFDPVAFLERAVRTPSHEDVTAMRELLLGALDGFDPDVDGAGNVIASRGSGSPHYVLNTHVDTVPPHVDFERDGDVIRGRGSCDAKGPLAALVAAFRRVDPEEGRVTLAVTPDEETYSTGAAALDPGDADGYVVGEPTGLDVCTAARGRFEGTVTIGGRAAHAGTPGEGVNAVAALRYALAAVETFDDERGPGPHVDLGAPTLTPTTVTGGDATNQVPATSRFVVDRRSVPPETAAEFRDALRAHLREYVPADVEVEFALTERDTPFLEAFATPAGDPLVEALAAASGGAVRPFDAATEASYFAAEAPTVVFGPGDIEVAHAADEYVRASDVTRAADAVAGALDRLV